MKSWRFGRRDLVVIASPGGRDAGGGMGTVTRLIADEIDGSGTGLRAAVLDPRGAGSGMLWPPYFGRAAARLLAWCLVGRVALVHLQVSERSSFLRKGALLWLARLFGCPTVLHHHGAELITTYRTGRAIFRPVIRWSVRAASVNLVLGERWRAFLTTELGVPADRVRVLFNATPDLWEGPAPFSAEAALAGREPTLLLLANLSPRKGVGEMLDATARLRAAGRPIRLILAGGGEIARYEAEAARLGIADLCRFTGWIGRPEVEALLRSAGTLVLPSHREGLPMAILEALSAGLPVVATPVGSIPEVLTDGRDCLLVPPGDGKALADALTRASGDEALRRLLAANGRALYEARFSAATYRDTLLGLYAELLTGEPSR